MRKIKRVSFDEKRAIDIFEIISDLWTRRDDVFSSFSNPYSKISEIIKDPVKKANFIFVLIMAERGPIFSEQIINWFLKLWENDPRVFDPKEKIDKKNLVKLFVKNGIIRNNQKNFLFSNFFDYWVHNFNILREDYGGNILNIFTGVEKLSQLFKRVNSNRLILIKDFQGIKVKLLTHVTIILQEHELLKFFPTPLPPDFHRMRLLWSTEIMNLKDYEKPYSEIPRATQVNVWYTHDNQIGLWSEEFLIKNNFSHLILSTALWYFSRNRCSKANKRGKKRIEICNGCPLTKYCNWVIPSHPFYGGKSSLLVRYKRIK